MYKAHSIQKTCLWLKQQKDYTHMLECTLYIQDSKQTISFTRHLNIKVLVSHISSVARVKDVHSFVSPVRSRNKVSVSRLMVHGTQETVPYRTLFDLEIWYSLSQKIVFRLLIVYRTNHFHLQELDKN